MRFIRENPIALLFIFLLGAQVILGGLGNPMNWIMSSLINLPGIIIGLSFHEFAHAKVSNLLGDDLPLRQGRVTINPAAHIDPVGFIALLFIGFGWGKPVQINPGMYKHPRRDEFLVAIAGVTMNLLLAILFAIILKLIFTFQSGFILTSLGGIVTDMITSVISINLVLMVFNLLPIPPLDGFNIVTQLFNLRNTQFYYQVYNKGFIILMLLILFNVTDYILFPAVQFFYGLIMNFVF